MAVPFVDLNRQYAMIKDEVQSGFDRVCEGGGFILGKEAKDFETAFAGFCQAEYAVGVNSGTDALYLALSALGIGPGDEVIVPTHTFIATALCVSYTGARPVFVDVQADTYAIDPDAFARAVTPRTKAVLPVHIYGQPVDMDEISAVARRHHIKIIEDAAQAHGAVYHDRRIGSLGDIACFSFYPTKNLGAFGDAGMVVTSDREIYERVLMLRDYGRQGRYEHKIKGHNSRLDTLQAVVLSAKLPHLAEWNRLRQEAAGWYAEDLGGVAGVQIPAVRNDRTHVYHLYVIRVKDRERVLSALKDAGIGALIHYPIPIHLQEAYQDAGYHRGDFPVAEAAADEIVSLPMFPYMTRAQVDEVARVVAEAVQ